jgi:two-component system sensor histidine kinase YesM
LIPGLEKLMRRLQVRGFGTIFFKNLSLLSVLILFPIILVAVLAGLSFSASMKSEIRSYSYKSLQNYKNLTDTMIADYMAQSHHLGNDSDVELFLLQRNNDTVYYDRNVIHNLLNSQMSMKEYLDSIYIYSNRSGRIISNYGESSYKDFFDHSWMQEYQANTVPSRFWCVFRTGLNNQNRPIQVLSIYKALGTLTDNQGVIVFNINWGKFARQLAEWRGENDSGLYLVDESGKRLADIWQEEGTSLPASVTARIREEPSYVESGSSIFYNTPVHATGWHYILAVSNSVYYGSLRPLLVSMLVIVAIWLLATAIIAVLISLRIYRPIRSILGALRDYSPLVEESRLLPKDEEGYIITAIQRTLREHEAVSVQLTERIGMLKKAQSIALQSQINPHFLHNTLDSINWSAMGLTGGKNETSVMITQLASMLRYSLEDGSKLVPLEKELEHIRTYLNLQMIRYRNKFRVEWEVAAEIKHCRVIKIMLQPILENAIYHGIKPMEGAGIITITAKPNNGLLEIVIRDNGVGMDRLKVRRINSLMQQTDIQEKAHIGIPNVNQRIQLFFGEEYGITVASAEQEGTEVLLRLPYLTGDGQAP